jgi:hypothetical protein
VTRFTALVSALAVAVLTGCSARLGGLPLPATTLDEPSAITAEVLGDLSTIEPCTLTGPEVFSEFGSAEFAAPESLDYCTVSVKPDTSSEVVVTVGQLGRLSDRPELETQRLEDVDDGLYTARSSDDPSFCSQVLVFAEDDLTLDVSGSVFTGTVTTACDMVAAGMGKVIEVIQDGNVGHRFPEPASLVTLDPCDLVSDATVTAQPGFAAATRRDNPGGHLCSWATSTGADRVSLSVVFGAGSMPEVAAASESNTDPIAGRPSVTNMFPTSGSLTFCLVETGHISFTEFEEHLGMVEVASVYARVPAAQQRIACPAAVAVATEVWPKLPPA